MQRAIDIDVFEFAGQQAGDGVNIFAVESGRPILFRFDESSLRLRLVFRAIGGEGRQGE